MIAATTAIDDSQLRADSARMDQLLGELHDRVDPVAWQHIQQVMRCTVELYSQALAHTLDHARAAATEPAQFDARIGEDELVASLLVLHGLHPLSTEDRANHALALLCRHLGVADDAAVIVTIEDGVAHVASRIDEDLVRRALEAAAPELADVAFTTLS
jgi:hypothetical protein